jgi:hypothetical protein
MAEMIEAFILFSFTSETPHDCSVSPVKPVFFAALAAQGGWKALHHGGLRHWRAALCQYWRFRTP